MKKIFVINGSASSNSSNQRLIDNVALRTKDFFTFKICRDLKKLPHFDPELSSENTPEEILEFRRDIEMADAVLICTPEYIFSIPSGLKNAIEWCVSTTVFSDKPLGIITASASGEKGHEELKMIMKTVMAVFTVDTTLLIKGIKGKLDLSGEIIDEYTENVIHKFITGFKNLVFQDES